jgi:outer membrane protein assembly factor BamD
VNRLLAILTIFIFVSCSEYGEVLKKGTLTQKYDYAVKAYQKKDYVRALPLFEELLAAYRGQPKSEEIYFYYCYCYFGQGQYELAAYHFKNFTENYYNSKHMEECALCTPNVCIKTPYHIS